MEIPNDSIVLLYLKERWDSLEAVVFLCIEEKYIEASCPDLILDEFNMPKQDSCDAIDEVKTDEYLELTQVIFLTTSEDFWLIFVKLLLGCKR